MPIDRVIAPPKRKHYVLHNARVPVACLQGVEEKLLSDADNLAIVDIEVKDGKVMEVVQSTGHPGSKGFLGGPQIIDLQGKMVLPTFIDLHTHIGRWLALHTTIPDDLVSKTQYHLDFAWNGYPYR